MNTLFKITRLFKRIFFWVLAVFGSMALFMLALAFTDIPYWAYHRLGTSDQQREMAPEAIVLLGGNGIPSPDGLVRVYYAAIAAQRFPHARVVIAIPSVEGDSLQPLHLMAAELVLKGIGEERIVFEPKGFNTHSQAVNIAAHFGGHRKTMSLLVVTSPEHVFRAVRCFRNEGFAEVGGLPAFEVPLEEEQLKDKDNTKDLRVKGLSLRYNAWSYLHYELLVLREYCAIGYYWIKGWI